MFQFSFLSQGRTCGEGEIHVDPPGLGFSLPYAQQFWFAASFPAGALPLWPLGGVLGKLPCKVACSGVSEHIVMCIKRAGEMEFGDLKRHIDCFCKA